MDRTILNGNKLRLYNQGNSQLGSIQYTGSKLSIKGNSAGSGVLITDGKLLNTYNTNSIYIQKQQTSLNVFQAWSDGSSEELKHIFTFTAPGYEMYQTTPTITQDKNWTITLYPPSQPSVATDIPGIQIGERIAL